MRERHWTRPVMAVVAGLFAASAWAGALGMIAGLLAVDRSLASRLPFDSPVFGGVALAVVVGMPMSWAAAWTWRNRPRWRDAVSLAGVILTGWIVVEVLVVRQFSVLQPVCAVAGAAMAVIGNRAVVRQVADVLRAVPLFVAHRSRGSLPMTTSQSRAGMRSAIGWLAVTSSVAYFASDVLEAAHGGFTASQLWLTLAAEATLPFFVIGLYAAQRPWIGKLGTFGAVGYATAYAYFSYTVVYALTHHTRDFAALSRALDPAMTIAGVAMVAAGLAFGAATYRAAVLCRWAGPTLAVGVALVAITTNAPALVQLGAVGVRDSAFVGMGLALIRTLRRRIDAAPHARSAEVHLADTRVSDAAANSIDLYWIPLGAGGHVVQLNGRIYEAVLARHQHRKPQSLYHAALEIVDQGRRYVIEMAPVWSDKSTDRGVVCEGPVGLRFLGHLRAFTYEVRCWADGRIPDIAYAIDSPHRVSTDASAVARVLQTVRDVPSLTWGLDEIHAGEMWNSNSLVAWLLARAGQATEEIHPPTAGRAPGWSAGLTLAARQAQASRRELVRS